MPDNYSADTILGSGSVSSPGSGATIATVTLPARTAMPGITDDTQYYVEVTSYQTTPPGTDVDNSATGAASAIAATLPAGGVGVTTYITGFEVTGEGATAASNIVVTVTGILGGTKSYELAIPAGVNTTITPLVVEFPRPIPASAANTAIVVNVPSFGAGNLNEAVTAHGFQDTAQYIDSLHEASLQLQHGTTVLGTLPSGPNPVTIRVPRVTPTNDNDISVKTTAAIGGIVNATISATRIS